MFQLLGSFAEFERSTIRERTQDGYHRALRDGRRPGRIPYGYDIREDGEFVIVEDEARIVVQIIENIAGGSTCYAEARRLNDEGVPSPGWKFRGRPREYGPRWSATTTNSLLRQPAYGSGRHKVRLSSGEVAARPVPQVVAPELQERALRVLAENKRYSGGRKHRDYLLSGLVTCKTCGSACTGQTHTSRGKKYPYYRCSDSHPARSYRGPAHAAPYVRADWLEAIVWNDVRAFLENPGELLERVREQMKSDDATAELEARRADISKRLAAKSTEKDRYVRAFAAGHISEEELAEYVTDLKNQIDNLKLLIGGVENELTREREQVEVAESAAAWLLTLRERINEVEGDTPEAYRKRRELVMLLVEQVITSRDENGRSKIEVRYRFGPPEGPDPQSEYVSGERNSQAFSDRKPWWRASTATVVPTSMRASGGKILIHPTSNFFQSCSAVTALSKVASPSPSLARLWSTSYQARSLAPSREAPTSS